MILFTAAWRLFFPAAGLFAGLALPLWLLMHAGQVTPVTDPLAWHMHEMLFGYLPAALAGFLLTAIPNWTGRPALKGAPLAALFALWLAGRVAMFMAPAGFIAPLITVIFLPALGILAARDIIKSGNIRNLVVVALIGVMALAQALMLFGPAEIGINAGFATALALMALIGGRITPAFSRNWLMMRKATALPAPFGLVDKAAMASTIAAAISWSVSGSTAITGVLAIVASITLAARVARWQGWAVRSEPLLLAQHIAYLWLAIAMALLALNSLTDWVTLSQTRHAFGAGGVATMTMIVMLRAALGHSGRPIIGGFGDWLLFVTLHLGAALRVISGWMEEPAWVLNSAGLLWAFAFLLFAIRVIPIAMTPRQ
ncbi:MAG: NnrS family protein [Rhodobacteraceae bacterium]|nr:NnrS family protein [Paracoccaceae bacterium]